MAGIIDVRFCARQQHALHIAHDDDDDAYDDGNAAMLMAPASSYA